MDSWSLHARKATPETWENSCAEALVSAWPLLRAAWVLRAQSVFSCKRVRHTPEFVDRGLRMASPVTWAGWKELADK